MKPENLSKSFYEIQQRQKFGTFILFILLFMLYFLFLGVVYGFFYLVLFGILFQKVSFSFWHIIVISILSLATVLFQWYDAKRTGLEFVLGRLNAQDPDEGDLYHKKLVDIVEEMRIATGIPKKIRVYIIAANAINSFALMESNGTPVIGMTEGALARLSRDELQAAVAHELSHILNGDALYVTFVCSISNMFQKMVDSLEGKETDRGLIVFGGKYQARWMGPQVSGFFLSLFVLIFFRFWSLLISRKREYLADAAAAEMTRHPEALARAIFKAHTYYSFLGDAGEMYSPIFIVEPSSQGLLYRSEFLESLLSTHPPVKNRIEQLISMTSTPFHEFLQSLEEQQGQREKHRTIVKSIDEIRSESPVNAKKKAPALPPYEKNRVSGESVVHAGKLWEVRDQNGKWIGPFAPNELIMIPWFTGQTAIRTSGTTDQKPAHSFPEIMRIFSDSPTESQGTGLCPECGTKLISSKYEGVSIKSCPVCGGKAIPESGVMRIICRREVKPSPYLAEKANQWKAGHKMNPLRERKKSKNASFNSQCHQPPMLCPQCTRIMYERIFSYQYFIEIAQCRVCKLIWFKGDELEILQILIEKAGF